MKWLIAVVLLATGCDKGIESESPSAPTAVVKPASIRELSMAEVLAMQKKQAVVMVDVNDNASRTERGTVAGATLLKKPPRIGDELPADKDVTLVFYCWDDT